MSGPKVINIEAVRRRQKRQSHVELRKLQLALAECERWQAQPQAAESLARLETLRQAEQWEPLLHEARRLHDFYREESQRLRQQHAAQHVTTLQRAHRLLQSLAQIQAQLQTLPASAERDALISQLSSSELGDQESALNTALQFIGQSHDAQTSRRLSELAASLIDADAAAPTATRPQAAADPHQQRLEKCWQLLGELSTEDPSPELDTLSDQARRISSAPADQQPMLLDSLALRLSTHLQDQRALRVWREELELLLTELDEIRSPQAEAWRQRLTTALSQPASIELKPSLPTEARAWIDQTLAEETREDQRTAVLRALAAIGYEVREGMATAWVEQGRLILRKPNDPGYGVELSAPAQGNAVQTRIVAFGTQARDPQRDLEVEETWCDAFETARATLEAEGFQASLIQSHPAGAIPLKTIAQQTAPARQQTTRPTLNAKPDPR
ncbi:MAG: hypothetical protein KDK99_04300 [Verrucomicrobiales bacterium]|nr:hypothetical protein [Verrucomicrobiales bacterium]